MTTLADLLVQIGVDVNGLLKTEVAAKKVSSSLDGIRQKGTKAAAVLAGVSASLPYVGGATAGLVSLGTTLGAAGIAAGVFGAVAKSAISEVSDNATKVSDLTDKISLYHRELQFANQYGVDQSKILQSQAKAQTELAARLANLPPATRAATLSYIKMSQSWKDFVETNKPATFNLVSSGYGILGKAIKQLQPLFNIGALAAKRLLDAAGKALDGNFLGKVAKVAAPAMYSLVDIILNVARALSATFGKFGTKTGQGILDWLDKVTAKWAEWSTATDKQSGVNKLVGYLSSQGPKVLGLLTSLAKAAVNIAKGVGMMAPVTAAVAASLATLIAVIPPAVITALVAGFLAWSAALKVYAAYQAIATAAQWAMNSAFLASPLTWIVLGILALVAVIIYLATKTQFFQTIWRGVWGFLKMVGAWFAGPFAGFFVMVWHAIETGAIAVWHALVATWNAIRSFFSTIGHWFAGPFAGFFVSVWHSITGAFNSIKNAIGNALSWALNKGKAFALWYLGLPKRIGGALLNLFSPLARGFKGAINAIIRGWNSLHFSVPGFSFAGINVGGFSLGLPHIPQLAKGGITTGPTLAMIGEGRENEVVAPLSQLPKLAGRDERPIVVQIVPGGERAFRTWVNKSIRVKGALNAAVG